MPVNRGLPHKEQSSSSASEQEFGCKPARSPLACRRAPLGEENAVTPEHRHANAGGTVVGGLCGSSREPRWTGGVPEARRLPLEQFLEQVRSDGIGIARLLLERVTSGGDPVSLRRKTLQW